MNAHRLLGASVVALGTALLFAPSALADPDEPAPAPAPGLIQTEAAPTSDEAQPAAVAACSAFGQVLDGTSTYYGSFADSLEGSNYNDPAVAQSGQTGRQAMKEGAGIAMNAAGTPGLDPAIADPMRAWGSGAYALWAKMAVRVQGQGLDTTVTSMNENAEKVQFACSHAGTHA